MEFVWRLIEDGESAEECAIREIEEELEATIENIVLLEERVREEENTKVVEYIFSAEIVEDFDQLTLHEGAKMQLFSKEELLELDIVDHYKDILTNL